MSLIFDIETNDKEIANQKNLWCIVIYCTEMEELWHFSDYASQVPDSYEAIELLEDEDVEIVGHNIIDFDIPALQQFFPDFKLRGKITDTLLDSRLIWSDTPGGHSLAKWGEFLGYHKQEWNDFSQWHPAMLYYCQRDVEVSTKVYDYIESFEYSPTARWLEHDFGKLIRKQKTHGVPFDAIECSRLVHVIRSDQQRIENKLKRDVKPWFKSKGVFTPKRDNKKLGYKEGCPMTKIERVGFNPGSRDQVAYVLQSKYGWKPKKNEYTEKGTRPRVDEEVLGKLNIDIAKDLTNYLTYNKRLGQLADGDKAWLKEVTEDGYIHGDLITNGAVTGRCTHSNPNLAQVPAVKSMYGPECRALFHAPEGYEMVGFDASSLELRCLGHFMAFFDGGAFAKTVVEDDIHEQNRKTVGLESRDTAKVFIYSTVYGAGDEKVGSIVYPTGTKNQKIKAGKELKKLFFTRIPALEKVITAVQGKVSKREREEGFGYLVGLDGRRLPIRSSHSALNTLLQNAGGVIMKYVPVETDKQMQLDGWEWGVDYAQMLHVHDEAQYKSLPEASEYLGETAKAKIKEAEWFFNFKCQLDGEYKIGQNWAETH